MVTDVVRVKIEFLLPEKQCLYTISKKYPDLLFKNISMLPLPEEMGNTLIEVGGVKVSHLLNDLKGNPNIVDQKIVYEAPDQTLVNIKVEDPLILKFMSAHQVIPDYPLVIQNGRGTLHLIGERKNIDALLSDMERKGVSVQVKSIGASEPRDILTGKQKDLLVKTLKKGFFEVPRKVSLSDLAAEFDVSPAALSEMVRRLSKRLAEHYISSP